MLFKLSLIFVFEAIIKLLLCEVKLFLEKALKIFYAGIDFREASLIFLTDFFYNLSKFLMEG
jgi:hypothetical protein